MDAQELTHATISNGWFREVSDESFPGQALELRVKKILYTGKSAFQDVSDTLVTFRDVVHY